MELPNRCTKHGRLHYESCSENPVVVREMIDFSSIVPPTPKYSVTPGNLGDIFVCLPDQLYIAIELLCPSGITLHFYKLTQAILLSLYSIELLFK